MQLTPWSAEAGQHRVVWRRVRFPEHDKSRLEQVWLRRRTLDELMSSDCAVRKVPRAGRVQQRDVEGVFGQM